MIAHLALFAALSLAPLPEARPEIASAVVAQDATRAIADRIIAAADAEGIFVNSSKGDVAQVTHAASGMTCRFQGLPTDRVSIFPTVEGGPSRGDDVSCVYRDETLGIDINVYATRYGAQVSEAEALRNANAAIQQRYPDATPYTGNLTTASIAGQSAPLVSAFKIQGDGGEMLTLAMVSHRGDWAFKVRATGPYAEARMVSLYSAMLLESSLTPMP
jgi:hypothetical protein